MAVPPRMFDDKVLNEPVFRAPPSLNAFTFLSHDVRANQNAEDTLYRGVCSSRPHTDLDNPGNSIEPLLWWFENICSDDGYFLLGPEGRIKLDRLYNLPEDYRRVPFNDPNHAIRQTARLIDTSVREIIVTRPELFLFGCYSHVVSLINDHVTPDALNSVNVSFLRLLSRHLYVLLRENRSILRSVMSQRASEFEKRIIRNHRPNTGGFIQYIKKKFEHKANTDVFEENVIHLDLKKSKTDLECYYRVKWHRENLYWSYTFFESPNISPLYLYSDAKNAELPYLSLNQQSRLKIAEYEETVGKYLAILLHLFLKPSVKESPYLYQMIQEANALELPGQHLATAHYVFLPIGILVLFLYFPEWSLRKAENQLSNARFFQNRPSYENMKKELVQIILGMHKEENFKSFPNLLVTSDSGKFRNIAEDCNKAIKPNTTVSSYVPNSSVIEFLMLGGQLYQTFSTNRDSRSAVISDFGESITRLCASFWRALGSCSHLAPTKDWDNKNYMDFVSCYVDNHRGVYFTNFQPSGADRSTKTLFIDLAFTGFQRAQLAQRLCDIATYRNISLKDIDRVRAMMSGMNEISIELNGLLGEPVISYGDDVQDLPKEEADCKVLIRKLNEIQQQIEQMNRFIAYGIKGRHAAASDFLTLIRERTRDNRQNEITNFPDLKDFLERRVADGIRDAERMSKTYDHLSGRIAESFNRVRTRLNFIQTANISAFSRNTSEITEELSKTATNNRDQTTQLLNTMRAMNNQTERMVTIVAAQEQHSKELNQMNRTQEQWSKVLFVVGFANFAYIIMEMLRWLVPNNQDHKPFIFVTTFVCISGFIFVATHRKTGMMLPLTRGRWVTALNTWRNFARPNSAHISPPKGGATSRSPISRFASVWRRLTGT